MRSLFILLCTASLCCFSLGCATTSAAGGDSAAAESHDAAACSCPDGKAGGTTWCDACGVGYVDGNKVGCKGCVTKAQSGTACAGCDGAKAEGAGDAACSCGAGKAGGTTWCDACGVGYVDGNKVGCKGCVTKAQSGTPCAGCDG
jgi:hypothetical protein